MKSLPPLKGHISWEVTVSNLGTVYSGNGRDAKRCFANYRDISKSGLGRAGGESVVLWKDGELVKEHIGAANLEAGCV